MTDTNEAVQVEILNQLTNLSNAYVKLEVTNRTELKALSDSISEVRTILRDQGQMLSDHSNRITAGSTRIDNLQEDRVEMVRVLSRVAVLEEAVKHITPQKTQWTAVVSAVVAIGALAWTFFGK